MAYFKLEASELLPYPLDYHSHFSGILPVHIRKGPKFPESLTGVILRVGRDEGWGGFAGDDPHAPARAQLKLFDYALGFMIASDTNPFARLLKSANRAQYERAECAAENIYIGSVLLGKRFGDLPFEMLAQPADMPDLYTAVRRWVISPAMLAAPDDKLVETVAYFNSKIFSTSKYTPYDDSYKLRGWFVKQLCDGDPAKYSSWKKEQRLKYRYWIRSTFDYLRLREHITHTQTAIGEDEMLALALETQSYNEQYKTSYKLLVHTAHGYLPAGVLKAHLHDKVAPLLELQSNGLADVIGVDLLGVENKVASYQELFAFLKEIVSEGTLAKNFGSDDKRSLKVIAHIHCGEGVGFGADSRSMIGYYMYEVGTPGASFYADLAAYVLSCYKAALLRRADTPRPTAGTPIPTGLFDELFQHNSLTHNGRPLRRFTISGEHARELAAFNAKRSIMAFSETLDARIDETSDNPATWADWLDTGPGTAVAVRLGHAFYYRNYIAAKYPKVAYDTNLGSNAITGASGLFSSIEGYRINRGYRHLEGYIDTNVLQATVDAVAYIGAEALTKQQAAKLVTIAAKGPLDKIQGDNDSAGWIREQLKAALGAIYDLDLEAYLFQMYWELVQQTVGDESQAALRYQALSRVLAFFQNWRSCLLGADGQGIEHTSIQNEFLRMLILMAYSLLPSGQAGVVDKTLLNTLQLVVATIAVLYWRSTVNGQTEFHLEGRPLGIEIVGFKAPDSVVTLRRMPGLA